MRKYKILILWVIITISSLSYVNANDDIDSLFYYNQSYINDKNILLNEFNKSWSNWVSKCLNEFWKKYFISTENIKKYCTFQIKYYFYKNWDKLKKSYPYIWKDEEAFFYKNWKNIINNNILKYISINIKESEIKENLKSDELTLLQWFSINKLVINDFNELNIEYKKIFWEDIIINSGYRTIEQQKSVYDNYTKKYWVNQKIAIKYWFSEHHLWTAIDIKKLIIIDQKWKSILNYDWLKQNAWKYGFIQSFNYNCSNIWIINEDWHYRWIWKKFATQWKSWEYENKTQCNALFLKWENKK